MKKQTFKWKIGKYNVSVTELKKLDYAGRGWRMTITRREENKNAHLYQNNYETSGESFRQALNWLGYVGKLK